MKNLLIQIQGLENAVGKGIISYGTFMALFNILTKEYLEKVKEMYEIS